ncbi:hypothetical protein ACO02O_00891 [Dirofilaria immitis]
MDWKYRELIGDFTAGSGGRLHAGNSAKVVRKIFQSRGGEKSRCRRRCCVCFLLAVSYLGQCYYQIWKTLLVFSRISDKKNECVLTILLDIFSQSLSTCELTYDGHNSCILSIA